MNKPGKFLDALYVGFAENLNFKRDHRHFKTFQTPLKSLQYTSKRPRNGCKQQRKIFIWVKKRSFLNAEMNTPGVEF